MFYNVVTGHEGKCQGTGWGREFYSRIHCKKSVDVISNITFWGNKFDFHHCWRTDVCCEVWNTHNSILSNRIRFVKGTVNVMDFIQNNLKYGNLSDVMSVKPNFVLNIHTFEGVSIGLLSSVET